MLLSQNDKKHPPFGFMDEPAYGVPACGTPYENNHLTSQMDYRSAWHKRKTRGQVFSFSHLSMMQSLIISTEDTVFAIKFFA